MNSLTMKFGGTSVGTADAIHQATDIIVEQSEHWDGVAVVVSAMSGTTDLLMRGATTAADGDEQTYKSLAIEIRNKHTQVIDELVLESERKELRATIEGFINEFSTFCHGVCILGEVTPRAMDAIVSFGERMNARVIAAVLRKKGLNSEAIDATELIVTDDAFQKAVPKMEATCEQIQANLVPMLNDHIVPIITGFIGATQSGLITTLGRGGSDYSAAIIGTCLDSKEVWIWTDVDGVMTTDPRAVKNARVIPLLSAGEISELAYFGAKVLHPRTIWPVLERGTPLWVKNTFNPTFPGTRIVREPETKKGEIKAVAVIKNLSLVSVEGRGMMGVPGIAARTFSAVARQKANVLMISQASSEQSICFVIPTDSVPPVVKALEKEFTLELERADINNVWSMDNIVIVTAVGTGIRSTPGLASKIFNALGAASINIVAIAQGSSEFGISLIVSSADADAAVQQIHEQVINHVK